MDSDNNIKIFCNLQKTSGLRIDEASLLCKEGKKLRRSIWSKTVFCNAYLFFSEDLNSIRIYVDNLHNNIIPKYEDIINHDWEIIE